MKCTRILVGLLKYSHRLACDENKFVAAEFCGLRIICSPALSDIYVGSPVELFPYLLVILFTLP
jgi:hypothetical protein